MVFSFINDLNDVTNNYDVLPSKKDLGTEYRTSEPRKKHAALKLIDISFRLSELRPVLHSKHHGKLDAIESRLFEVTNDIEGLDIKEFASHRPGDKTPVKNNGGCSC